MKMFAKFFFLGFGLSLVACANIKGGITGTVFDPADKPMAGAKVEVFDKKQDKNVYEIVTGADGRFEYYETNFVVFNGYCGPSLKVTVSKAGFFTVEKDFDHLCEVKEYNPGLLAN